MRVFSKWKVVRAQSVLGEEEFTTTLMDYLRGKRDIAELPNLQRYADRPSLQQIFSRRIVQNIGKRNGKRNEKIQEAV